MAIFIQRVSIAQNNKVDISYDENTVLNTIFLKERYVGEEYILLLHDELEYVINLSEYVVNEIVDTSITINELIHSLSEKEIFTYHLPEFNNFENLLTTMSYGDFRDTISVKACNQSLDEDSVLLNDPGYTDLSIRYLNRDLTNVIPVIDNIIYKPAWANGAIYLHDKVKLLLTNPDIFFLTFSKVDTLVIKGFETVDDTISIPEGTTPILVYDGVLMFDETALYKHNNTLRIGTSLKEKILGIASNIYNPLSNTFIIFVKGNRIVIHDVANSIVSKNTIEFYTRSRFVITRDRNDNVHSNVTTCFTVPGGTRKYCHTVIPNPKVNQIFVL